MGLITIKIKICVRLFPFDMRRPTAVWYRNIVKRFAYNLHFRSKIRIAHFRAECLWSQGIYNRTITMQMIDLCSPLSSVRILKRCANRSKRPLFTGGHADARETQFSLPGRTLVDSSRKLQHPTFYWTQDLSEHSTPAPTGTVAMMQQRRWNWNCRRENAGTASKQYFYIKTPMHLKGFGAQKKQ